VPRRSTVFDSSDWIDKQSLKIRRIMNNAAKKGAAMVRDNIMFDSSTGSEWHKKINARRKQNIGARKETGKMLESVKFSRAVMDPKTKMWEASFGFPYSPKGFRGIRDTRSSPKYKAKADTMRNPKFRPWASDKSYIAMQEYGSEMPGSNVRVGMFATRKALVEVKAEVLREMGKLYKKAK